MPFTFSHPALIIPVYFLRRNYFSLTGLVMGSIAPDFEYFIRMKKGPSVYSHTLPALFWFSLPMALGLAFLFHIGVKKSLIHNLPPWFFNRFSSYANFAWFLYFKQHWIKVLSSILIGAASHILWDWFTHYSIVYTNGNQRLVCTLLTQNFQIYTYTLIHILYSLFGLAFLFMFLLQIPVSDTQAEASRDKGYWIKILFLSTIIMLIRIYLGSSLNTDDLAVTSISAILIATTLVSYKQKFL